MLAQAGLKIGKVGVIGCGQMGSGIAQVAAAAGYSTVVVEATQELCDRGIDNIDKRLERLVQKKALKPEEKAAIRARLVGVADKGALAECDLLIEAIIEDMSEKIKLWRSVAGLVKQDAILASNTSSLSITEMMIATRRPERFLGMHFFHPVPVLELVELVRTLATQEDVFESAVQFTHTLGKTAVRTWDRPGFIVNRLLIPYLMDAIRALEEGVGSITDIDVSMKLGCGHPMGPFVLMDFIGLDTTYYIANILFEGFREPRFAPPALLRRLVIAGWLGRKSGKGFYDYASDQPVPLDQLLRL
jgi:3-hydroxybutyryl-CoA dehydrogenase